MNIRNEIEQGQGKARESENLGKMSEKFKIFKIVVKEESLN